jgi:ligand-binding SRPBCC domain-containing protein
LNTYFLCKELWVPAPVESVFSFFSDAQNLNEITPGWLDFHVLTALPIEMKEGTLIDYKLRLRGIPIRWRSEILKWNPPFCFVDTQVVGPYRKWIHTHSFVSKDGGTVIRDEVEYAVGAGWLGYFLNRFLVRPDLEKIFHFRYRKLASRYGLTPIPN